MEKDYFVFGKIKPKRNAFFQIIAFLIIFTDIGVLGCIFNVGTRLIFIIIALQLSPMLALSVRRIHDFGLKWQWILLLFIPIVGQFMLIAMTYCEGQPIDNLYGKVCK